MKTDDPKLTAYALDELDPAERAEVEQLLREHPQAAAELAEVRSVATLLESTLRNEEAPPLSAEHRDAVLRAVPQAKVIAGPSWWRSWQGASVAAACAVFGFGAWAIFQTMTEPRPRITATRPNKPDEGPTISVPSPEPEVKSGALLAVNEAPVLDAAPIVATVPMPVVAAAPQAVDGKVTVNTGELLAKAEPVAQPAASPVTVTKEWERPFRKFEPQSVDITSTTSATPAKGMLAGGLPGTMRGRVGAGTARPKVAYASKPSPSTRMRSDDAKPVFGVNSLSAVGDAEAAGNTEAYDAIEDNAFKRVADEPLSTFSVDVDTASYANVRRMLRDQQRPPQGAVRIEELVNYFTYDYEQPSGDAPFSVNLEVATCPWEPTHRLLRVGLKGKDMARKDRPAANLVFLVDVSGSMNSRDKLPLVKESLQMLVDQMRDQDRIALVVYAGSSGLVQDSTSDKADIRRAIANLEAGGSTNGGSGIQLAYRTAREHLVKDGTNRVILCTDGDFNVGTTSQSELVKLIERERKSGVFLSILGFGTGNLKDSTMEKLADKGNGNYAYVDGIAEAKKVLVDQMVGTLVTIAKDVKLQLEFNPAQVGTYRLIGYENRVLAAADFNDDRKDAGEIGAGHTVTALYELVPPGADKATVDALKYQPTEKAKSAVPADLKKELLTVKLRYKEPTGDTSKLLEFPLADNGNKWEQSSPDFRWAASVASFGMILRDSPHRAGASWDLVSELAAEAKGEDRKGYRAEFLQLIEKAKVVAPMKRH